MKAIIWDIDGTLIESESTHLSVLEKVIKKYDEVDVDPKSTIGKTTLQILKHYFSYADDYFLHKLEQEVILEYAQSIEPGCIRPGILKLIKELTNLKIRQCCASNGETDIVLANMNLSPVFRNNFDFYLSSNDVSAGKPSPEILYLACNKLQLNKKDVIVVEDSNTGLQAALKANMKVILISDDIEMHKMYKKIIPIVRNTNELRSLLMQQYGHGRSNLVSLAQ